MVSLIDFTEAVIDRIGIQLVDSNVQPTIIKEFEDERGRIEVTPVFTETFRATSENDNRTHRTLCGQTLVERIGEGEWHVTIEGVVIKDQLDELKEMRPADGEVKVISEGYEGYVEFDRFTFQQKDSLNTGSFKYKGEEIIQSLFEFQLQTDEGED